MLELIVLALAVVAVVKLRGMLSRLASLEKQSRDLSEQVAILKRGQMEGYPHSHGFQPGRPPSTDPATESAAPPLEPEARAPASGMASVSASDGPDASDENKPADMAAEAASEAPTSAGSVPPIVPPPGSTPGLPSAIPPSAPSASLEERLGTRWTVWVGGLALALGGLLLVRYSIEQGYFGPAARVTMGLMLAALLAAAGEWFRRGERDLGLTAIPSAHIPGVLTAAGTVTAFGAIYAGHALYGLIGSATAFLLLGAIGIATLFAAALHGPALGALGLAGSYVAPMLVSSARPNPWPLVIYFAVVAASSMGLARVRRWLWLAVLAVAGAALWGFIFLEQSTAYAGAEWRLAGYLHTLIQLALAAVFVAVAPNRDVADADAQPDPIASISLGALALVAIVMLAAGRFELSSSIPFALAAAAILMAAAWLTAPAVAGALLAGAVIICAAVTWTGLKVPTDKLPQPHELWYVLSIPESISGFLTFSTLASLALLAVATVRLRLTRQLSAPMTALYALAAILTPLLALVIAYLRVTQFDTSISFAFAGAALAAIFAVIASRFDQSEQQESASDRLATGAFAAASIAAFSFGLVAFLDRGYLTVALALAALGTAFVATRRDVPLLRHVVTALAIVVLGRIAWDPRIMGESVGSLPILNWLLVGYGVPALCFWAAARQMETRDAGVSPRIADATAVVLTGLLAYFQIRHALHKGDVFALTSSHIEMGLMALVSLGLSYALLRLDLGRTNIVFRIASIAFGVISGVFILLGLGFAENPLLHRQVVLGPVIFSSLALAYFLPGVMATVVARASRGVRPHWYVTGLAVLAALLMFAYVTLELRHAFQGQYIFHRQRTSQMEIWSYSAVWLLLGIAFLGYGILRRSFEARLASAALVLLSVVKVFLYDLAGLAGIWRPLSFIVLGLVLIGIGLTYQRLLFGGRAPTGPSDSPGGAAQA